MTSPIVIEIPPPPPPPEEESAAQSRAADQEYDTIYDKARAIITEAEANNTPIWFRDGTEEPQT